MAATAAMARRCAAEPSHEPDLAPWGAAQGGGGERLALVTDRAQGGASLKPGQMEGMVHRRTLLDDIRGVGEPLNETMCGCRECECAGLIARGTHRLTLQARMHAAPLPAGHCHPRRPCNSSSEIIESRCCKTAGPLMEESLL